MAPGKGRKQSGPSLDRRRAETYLLAMSKRISSLSRPRAFGYVRVSTSKQAEEGGSLEAQREAILRHAVFSGYDLVSVSEDAGISGSKGEDKRPGLAEALTAIRDGRAEVLIVTHADRLARSIDETGHARVEVKRAGGRVDVISEAKNDPVRQAVDQMLAELERIRGSQRMAAWNAARKAKGLPAGPPPFGYRIDEAGRLVPDEAHRAAVDRILRLRKRGRTLRAIADTMNEANVPAPRAGRWNPMTVSLILKREKKPTKEPVNSTTRIRVS